ncbi:hypothetical protein [Kitasatospora sp. NPDC097643]|uniref:hypothetical protein n=1 Tax=Kitasatospora sp. NPDC097643 TaxID=3157230 RepID=UPI00332A5098
MGAGLFNDHGNSAWGVMLMASGETVDHLSCQGRDFPVRAAYSAYVGGVLRTVYTVVIPRSLQGEYRVAVRRDDQPVEEHLALNLDKGDAVQC